MCIGLMPLLKGSLSNSSLKWWVFENILTVKKVKNVCESEVHLRDSPGGPVVKTPHFHCRGHGFDPWPGN